MATNSKDAVLGSGRYGTVFRGEWNGKRVAVKRIELAKCANKKEEEALQNLDHPNVVKLFEVESDRDFKYYALEFCQASLDQKFLDDKKERKYRGPMPPDEEVCLQLAKGLAHIHEKKFIHRDLKPHNVLIWADSRQEKVVMKWADFGLSKQVNERGSHSISGMRGTHNWHSPEILKIFDEEGNDGKTTSPDIRPRGTVKSDVFSAGLVFGYYLLGGDHPFGSPINVLPNILKNEPVNMPKIKLNPMHAIIMEMLKADPNERISSADVVIRIKFFTIQKKHYENRVEEYKKKMRKEINAFFKSPQNSKVTQWKESEKNTKFEEMFKKILDEAKKEFPTTDVQREIKKVVQNSIVIKNRQIEINWTDTLFIGPDVPAEMNKEDKSNGFQPLNFIKRQFPVLFNDNENDKEKQTKKAITLCADSVNDAVNRIAAGTLCYDNSIVSHIIIEIDSKLREYQLNDHSVFQYMFQYGMGLTVNLMKKVQDQWEKENSVPAKLESNKEILRKNFMMVSA